MNCLHIVSRKTAPHTSARPAMARNASTRKLSPPAHRSLPSREDPRSLSFRVATSIALGTWRNYYGSDGGERRGPQVLCQPQPRLLSPGSSAAATTAPAAHLDVKPTPELVITKDRCTYTIRNLHQEKSLHDHGARPPRDALCSLPYG